MEEINVKKQAWEFFVYATLGIVPKELFDELNYNGFLPPLENSEWNYEKYCTFMCAKAAYHDLCRTLTFKDQYRDIKGNKIDDIKAKEDAINSICVISMNAIYDSQGCIHTEPDKLFPLFTNDDGSVKNDFKLLEYLEKTDDHPQKINFGHIQKWVNMTMKYLYLLGFVKSDKNLHIPIDSYIIDALWEEKDVPLPIKSGERKTAYKKPSDHVVAWSQWTKTDYDNMFASIIKELKPSPMAWEHEAWIRIAETRKGVKETGAKEQI